MVDQTARSSENRDLSRPVGAIAVLGMHRSGTSALAGTLAEAGAYLGRVLAHSITHNRKGLQEPASVVFMHENLLQANGGSWDNPPPDIKWGKLHIAVRDLFIESRKGCEPWAVKDPRTLLVFDAWREACDGLTPVGIFRDPVSVARSLHKRNGFSILKGLSLWQAYNERLLHLARRLDAPTIEFTHDRLVMCSRLAAVCNRLGLSWDETAEFYDAALPSAPHEPFAVPKEIDSLHQALRECALDPSR